MRHLWILVSCLGLIANSAVAEDEPTAAADEPSAAAASESSASAEDVQDTPATETSEFGGPLQRRSYAVGVSIGRGLKNDGAKLDAELIGRGLRDALDGNELQMSNKGIRAAVTAFQRELRANAISSSADAAGLAFLKKNAMADGVVHLPSGLQYRVITDGTGARPSFTDRVLVRYRGKLVDGTVFDETDTKPASFTLPRLIPGWQQALPRMKVGSKWELVVPPELAYRDQAQDKIPANSVLVFELELVGIE